MKLTAIQIYNDFKELGSQGYEVTTEFDCGDIRLIEATKNNKILRITRIDNSVAMVLLDNDKKRGKAGHLDLEEDTYETFKKYFDKVLERM